MSELVPAEIPCYAGIGGENIQKIWESLSETGQSLFEVSMKMIIQGYNAEVWAHDGEVQLCLT